MVTALVGTGCSGPIDLTVVNGCDIELRIQTYDGTLVNGRWNADAEPLADFLVPAKAERHVEDALMFVTYPEEIRILEPVQRTFLINAADELGGRDNRWLVPSDACDDVS